MIDKKMLLSGLGLILCCGIAAGQGRSGVWVGTSATSGEFPPANSVAMSQSPVGDFHTGITAVGEDDKISFADYGDGAATPSRIAPLGHKDFPSSENWAYDIQGGTDIHDYPARQIATGIGGAFGNGPSSLADLYSKADKALYQVKQQGRNGTVLE